MTDHAKPAATFYPFAPSPGPVDESEGVDRPPFDRGFPSRVGPPQAAVGVLHRVDGSSEAVNSDLGPILTDDSSEAIYPVPGRTPIRNRRIAGHEIGHAFASRALGNVVHHVTIVPDRGPNGFEGRCVRSGSPSELALSPEAPAKTTDEILSICERLEKLTPELGSARVDSAEYYLRAQNNVIELVAAQCAELILHPELPPLGAVHDFVEAAAFAKIAVAAQPAVKALIAYAEAEATALLQANLDIVSALVEALIERGTLTGDEVDAIISRELATRSMRQEHKRRVDWHDRKASAAAFAEHQVRGL